MLATGAESIVDYAGTPHVLTPVELTAVACSTAFDLFSSMFLIWSLVRRRYVFHALALIACAFCCLWGVAFFLDAVVPIF